MNADSKHQRGTPTPENQQANQAPTKPANHVPNRHRKNGRPDKKIIVAPSLHSSIYVPSYIPSVERRPFFKRPAQNVNQKEELASILRKRLS
jgi:hypothetical protein